MEWLLTSNSAGARVLRTIIQGLIGLIPAITNYYAAYMPDWVGVVLVPVIMCILSPIMAEIGRAIEKDSVSVGGTE